MTEILLHDCGEILWVGHVANEKKTVVLMATYQDHHNEGRGNVERGSATRTSESLPSPEYGVQTP